MHKDIIIPVQIKKVRDPNGEETLKATVPMNIMFEKGFDAKWLREELTEIESRYFDLINHLRSIVQTLRSMKQKNGRVLLYWEFGNKMMEFEEQSKNTPLFLERFAQSLARDVGVSDKMIMRCRRFRLLYPDNKMIDPNRSFDSYVSSFEGGYISKGRRDKVRER